MKPLKRLLLVILILAGFASATAMAHGRWGHHHRGGVRFGVVIGAPFVRPWYPPPYRYWHGPAYYGPRYYYAPPPVILTAPPAVYTPPPPVYVERADVEEEPPAPAPGYWYYCRDPEGYYPTVKECPGGWEPMEPRL